jgi:hypothetical protein
VTHPALRRCLVLAVAGALAACRRAEPPGAAHPVDSLRAEAAALLIWQGGLPAWAVKELPQLAGVAPRGAVGLPRGAFDVRPKDLLTRPDAMLAVLEFASEAAARDGLTRLRAELPELGDRWLHERTILRLESTTAGASGVLGEQAWFRAVRHGLGVELGPSMEVIVDLRALRPAEATDSPWFRVPGLDSFLAAGLRWQETDSALRLRSFVRLARTPVGIAKAIDAGAAPLVLPGVLERARVASFAVERGRPQVFIDALQIATTGAVMGTFGPGPADFLRSLHSGFALAFRREFWACLSDEWAIAWPQATRLDVPCLVNALADREALLAQLHEVESQSGPLRVKRSAAGDAVVLEIDAFGQELIGVVGRHVAVLARAGSREQALAIAAGEPAAWTSPLAGAPHELVGAGHVRGPMRLGFLRLPVGLAERLQRPECAVVWHVTRAGDGLRIDAEVR